MSGKTHPILMSGAMVRALLEGRKTQTRRLLKGAWAKVRVGDLLWVRESGWQPSDPTPRDLREGADTWPKYWYDADAGFHIILNGNAEQFKDWGWKRRPSIHMLRWASRLTLRVVKVRRQRVRDISAHDCKAEGIQHFKNYRANTSPGTEHMFGYGFEEPGYCEPFRAFIFAWHAMYPCTGAKGCPCGACNPEVVAISFEVIRANVDEAARRAKA